MSVSLVLRVRGPSDNNEQTRALAPASAGVVVGSGSRSDVELRGDPEVDVAHGTLERTRTRGVWVYSDHSASGSTLNGKLKLHRDAVVLHHGDRLRLGQTEIEICLDPGKTEGHPEEEDAQEKEETMDTNQEMELGARSAARLARRRASTPWGAPPVSVSKAQQAKQRLPRIETSGPGFIEPGSFTALQPMATPPEYSASPVPGTRWRRKRNSIATTTLMAARRSPSPPLEQHGQPHSFHRSRTRFVQGEMLTTPPRSHLGEDATAQTTRPPPLEYSSSPSVSPSSLAARQRHNLFQQPPSSVPNPGAALIAGVPPPPFSAGARPTSRRDDLRIQVSKKMAAAAPANVGKVNVPRVVPKVLEFQAPASPVAQKDILKQQESLQTILQHKFEEEKLLKQQQEEWMKQHLMPVSSSDSEHRSGSSTPTPPLSPIKSENKSLAYIDPQELAFFPVQAPVLLRTLSLGISEQRTLRPSPRLTAAIRASRARLNSFEEKPESKHCDRKGRRKTTALVLNPGMQDQIDDQVRSPAKPNELRTSDDSVASTATTVVTCHRRVTRSQLSSGSASSVDLCDFMGYEEEEDSTDIITSYTTPEMYGSAELLRSSREDTTLLFDVSRGSGVSASSLYGSLSPPPSNTSSSLSPSNAAGTRMGSPRRQGTDTPDTSSSSKTSQAGRVGKCVGAGKAPTFSKTRLLSPPLTDAAVRCAFICQQQQQQLTKTRHATIRSFKAFPDEKYECIEWTYKNELDHGSVEYAICMDIQTC
ncbi:unnamed protein product [Phytophthora lilii]|uniref:Unnamed protein product n=1 Tax=Phytophthora lilii TaxID=2077276 RepID=A0A9W7CJ98_9STRA|nr:unnamed protein product [Phytophthora lilii]